MFKNKERGKVVNEEMLDLIGEIRFHLRQIELRNYDAANSVYDLAKRLRKVALQHSPMQRLFDGRDRKNEAKS